MIPLPFTLLFWVQVYTPFLRFLSKEYPSAFVGELVLVELNSLSFLLVSICVEYLFPALHFQSVCVLCFELCLL